MIFENFVRSEQGELAQAPNVRPFSPSHRLKSHNAHNADDAADNVEP